MWRLRLLVFVAILTGTAAPVWSRTALEELPVELTFLGPIDLYHGARLHVETITIGESGDGWSAGDVKFRFFLDVGPCPEVAAEMGGGDFLRRDAGVNKGFGLDDCPYQHEFKTGEMNVYDDDVLNIDQWVPEPTELIATSQARMFRYSDDLLRTRVDGTEFDLASDDFMGGVLIAFRCGFPGPPTYCPTRKFEADSCYDTPSGNTESWPCYQVTAELFIEPIRHHPDAHLDVTRVLASSAHCLADRDLTIGAHLVNPERVSTDTFRLRIARLDADNGTIVETWDSAARAGLGSDEKTSEPVTVTLRLGAGHHQLAIMAVEAGSGPRTDLIDVRSGGYMGTAAEVEINCLPELTDLPVFIERTATPDVLRDRDVPAVLPAQPIATATRERLELPSARPTATPTPNPRELPTRRGP